VTVMLPGSTVTWVLSANVLITVTLIVAHPIRVTCDDSRDHLVVLHAPNRSWARHKAQ